MSKRAALMGGGVLGVISVMIDLKLYKRYALIGCHFSRLCCGIAGEEFVMLKQIPGSQLNAGKWGLHRCECFCPTTEV